MFLKSVTYGPKTENIAQRVSNFKLPELFILNSSFQFSGISQFTQMLETWEL